MQKKQTKSAESEVHIAIQEPDNVRRVLLESAKDSIKFLQRQEKFEEIRSQKKALFDELKIILKELVYLNNKLDKEMPKVKVKKPSVEKELSNETNYKDVNSAVAERPSIARSRLDALEEELADIESRINSLK
jgi:valyl-tRNA synthetase